MKYIRNKRMTRKEFLIKSGILAGAFFAKDLFFLSEESKNKNVAAASGAPNISPNVIILMWSGVRFSETFGDISAQHIPYFKNYLLPEGTLYSNMYDRNLEFHTPAILNILTGRRYHYVSEDLSRLTTKYPTIFQYARKKYNEPADKYWEIGSGLFGVTAYCDSNGFGVDTRPCILPYRALDIYDSLPSELRDILDKDEVEYFKLISGNKYPFIWDAMTEVYFRLFKKIIKIYKPRLTLFYINHLDIAHSAHWAKYIGALRRTDEMTWKIWKIIRDDPQYQSNTYLIVTPDHERNRLFNHHWENTGIKPSHVWAYIYGPDIKKGKINLRTTSHEDICNTVAHMLKFNAVFSEGNILREAFTGFIEKK